MLALVLRRVTGSHHLELTMGARVQHLMMAKVALELLLVLTRVFMVWTKVAKVMELVLTCWLAWLQGWKS